MKEMNWDTLLQPAFFVPLLLFAAAVAGIVFFLFHALKTPQRRMKTLGAALALNWDDRNWKLYGDWEGLPLTIDYLVGGRGQRDGIRVVLAFPEAPSFPATVFRREGLHHRLFKSVRLSEEVQTSFAEFDRSVYVESEDDRRIAPFLRDTMLLQAILKLLREPHTELEIGKTENRSIGIVKKARWGWGRLFEPEHMKSLLSELCRLAEYWERTAPVEKVSGSSPPALVSGPSWSKKFLLSGAFIFFLGPALFWWGTFYPTLTWRLQLIGLGAGLIVALLIYLPVAFIAFRGRSTAYREFSSFAFFALVGFPTLFTGALTVLNAKADSRPPLKIAGFIARLPPGQKAEIRLRAGENSATIRIDLPESLRENARPGVPVTLETGQGFFSEPWLRGVGPAASRNSPEK